MVIILTPSYDICLTCLILHHVHISPPLLDGKLSVGREHILFIFVYSVAHGFQQVIFECAQQAHSEAMRMCRCVHALRAHLSQCIFLSSPWLTFWPVAFHITGHSPATTPVIFLLDVHLPLWQLLLTPSSPNLSPTCP